jgi:hypothetical protein
MFDREVVLPCAVLGIIDWILIESGKAKSQTAKLNARSYNIRNSLYGLGFRSGACATNGFKEKILIVEKFVDFK